MAKSGARINGPGYDDGYNDQHRHGRVTDGSYAMLDDLLSRILHFQPLR